MMENLLKIIIAGLDNAGKSSILTALDKKYDFHKDILSLAPTIRVEYQATEFLKKKIIFWDMGGQEKYRRMYQQKQDVYFADTDLLIYIIDIQDQERFNASLEYLDMILHHFIKNKIDLPLIVSFHKYDPELRGDESINQTMEDIRELILRKYPTFKILFQQTSIYDIISIIQLISYGFSVFDESFFDLSDLLEEYIGKFDCKSLIVFDKNGIIVSEFYNSEIEPEIYIELLESIKEHLFLLKRMQEESYETDFTFSSIGDSLLSYLHRIKLKEESIFISVIIQEKTKDQFLEKFSDFLESLTEILEPLL